MSTPVLTHGRARHTSGINALRKRTRHLWLFGLTAGHHGGAWELQVFVTWGAISWLPDIFRWAEIVAFFLRPGGTLYLAEAHPFALVFDDAAAQLDGRPGFHAPYLSRDPIVMQEAHDYVDENTKVTNATTHTWIHPLSDIITGLIEAGLRLDWLHEHDAVTWHMFEQLVEDGDGLWRWPDRPWLPLAFSLQATRL